jgi:hypothetical protein
MVTCIPTQLGDVLILRTTESYTIHSIGRVSKNGQQDFGTETNVKYEIDHAAAIARAKSLVVPGRRIFFLDIDTGDWSHI